MSRDIDIGLLRAFTAVVETGSVTAAARLLNRTQAAVSLQVKRLEDLFGKALFEREHRRLTLTQVGEHLIGPARRIVSLNDQLFGQMTTPDFEGEVRLGVPTDIVPTYIPPILRRYSQIHPRARVTLVTGNSHNLIEGLKAGQIDVVLSTDPQRYPTAEVLRVDELRWVAAPGSQIYRDQPLPLAIGELNCRFRPEVLDALRQAGREWRLVLESGSVAQQATVEAGIALTASLRDSVPSNLVLLDETCGLPTLPPFYINLHAAKTGGRPLVDELVRLIKQEFQARFGSASTSPAPRRSRARSSGDDA